MPTTEQAIACIEVCHRLSNLLQPIWVFRYDAVFRTIYLLAGNTEGIEIVVYPDGLWRFLQ